ncbi:MAG: helicase C-terminal domain-containing protein [Fusobacteriota bacterium]
MEITDKFEEVAITKIKESILEANGNEVFFKGVLNEVEKIAEVEVLARGNEKAVPALINRLKRGQVMIHNHPSGMLFPSDNDIRIASIYGNKDGGSYIVDNDMTDVYIINEPVIKKLEKVEIDEYFDKKGKLSQNFENYEYRHEQFEMAKVVEKALNEEKKAIIEAGTGTGKTLAYLIPTLAWALKNDRKLVVSTNTINLQEQLVKKDIPISRGVLDKDFKRVLVKGRGNYLCLRKVKNIEKLNLDDLNNAQKKELENITNWAGRTTTGDKNELANSVSYNVWEKVASEGDLCLGNKCYFRDKCFFAQARQKVDKADLLIVNHHMYFADLAIRKEMDFFTEYSILPNYDVVVFDEAHNLESVSKNYFSYEISKYKFTKVMNRIYDYKKRNSKKGGIIYLVLDYLRNEIDPSVYQNIQFLVDNEIINLHKDLFEKMKDLLDHIIANYSEEKDTKFRWTDEIKDTEIWKDVIQDRLKEVKNVYSVYLKKVLQIKEVIKEEDIEDEDGLVSDFFGYIKRLEEFFKTLNFLFNLDDLDYVYWIDINKKYKNIKFTATPLKIQDELDEILYRNIDTIFFTSATLAIEESFNYLKESIGLKEEVLEKIIDSPFNYKEQMKVIIPSDIKSPNNREFIKNSEVFLKKIIEYSKGNTFLLFTSYSMLNNAYYTLRDDLASEGYQLLVQGQYPRHKLLDMYKNSEKPILFGTDSFWEGVDVKGEKLRSVIIFKLPFRVPSDPVVEATLEQIKKDGKNPFMEYQIPEAIIKFKQGIGRLIRSKDDEGMVVLLDSRIVKKRYGEKFIHSLPHNAPIYVETKDQFIEMLGRTKNKK